ncbi:hypothetical protein K488DRAFT_54252 [Vararia minispora EC-137]|uniref:Uncharacterized protein n=1 Tax=Vararia minispora EC-137 TaxID=1314806 RepID=A0ACB8QFF5_9AGAM|nr:hypothetical protein K488DRAFT_54252 [Vararia minispora EC-137]
MHSNFRGKFTPEEKEQLLANLDLEVEQRTRQLEEWLSDTLTAFCLRHEGLISVIPPVVRSITIGDFSDKYDGDILAAVRGIQKDKRGYDTAPIDRTAMKRKWVQDQEADNHSEGPSRGGGHDGNVNKATKNRRCSPLISEYVLRLMPLSFPKLSRYIASPSPHKIARHGSIHLPSRPVSPSKVPVPGHPARVPSTTTFNPSLPKTPAYPPRWPRKHESMLSMNGSPLANPYELGLDWLAKTDSPDAGCGDGKLSSRTIPIVVRPEGSHSRSNSRTLGLSGQSSFAARVAVPTRDGHMLEFDPLVTSPIALDKLEGITNSAKKQAKEDMAKLLQQAVLKWNTES